MFHNGPILSGICEDCLKEFGSGKEVPMGFYLIEGDSEGKEHLFCGECVSSRFSHHDENGTYMPLGDVICDDCAKGLHSCYKKTFTVVGGVATRKYCACKTCHPSPAA